MDKPLVKTITILFHWTKKDTAVALRHTAIMVLQFYLCRRISEVLQTTRMQIVPLAAVSSLEGAGRVVFKLPLIEYGCMECHT